MTYRTTDIGAWSHAITVLYRNRDLVMEMTKREIGDRYAGQALGFVWSVLHPLFLMALYVFVFAVVFKTKITSIDMPQDYATYILSGLIPWLAMQDAMSRSCTAITASSGLVKQVVFPLEVLPVKVVLSTLFSQLVSSAVLLAYMLAQTGSLPTSVILVPLLIVLQVLFMTGIAYLLSAVGTYVRDIKDIVQLYGAAGMYLIPVVYLPGWVPAIFQPVIQANPFTYVIYCYQDALYFGRIERPWAWLAFTTLSVLAFAFGYRVFRQLKAGFGSAV